MAKKSTRSSPKTPAQPERKKDRLVSLLGREGGVTNKEMSESLGWQPHTTRAMLTALRKDGFIIGKVKGADGTLYSIKLDPAK